MYPTAMQPDKEEMKVEKIIEPDDMIKGANANRLDLRTQSQQENLQDLNELNLILIGDQGVGKT